MSAVLVLVGALAIVAFVFSLAYDRSRRRARAQDQFAATMNRRYDNDAVERHFSRRTRDTSSSLSSGSGYVGHDVSHWSDGGGSCDSGSSGGDSGGGGGCD